MAGAARLVLLLVAASMARSAAAETYVLIKVSVMS
jgi:hypothetical protein